MRKNIMPIIKDNYLNKADREFFNIAMIVQLRSNRSMFDCDPEEENNLIAIQ